MFYSSGSWVKGRGLGFEVTGKGSGFRAKG